MYILINRFQYVTRNCGGGHYVLSPPKQHPVWSTYRQWKCTILGRFGEWNDFRWVCFGFVLCCSSFFFQTYGFSSKINVEWEVDMISPQCKVFSVLLLFVCFGSRGVSFFRFCSHFILLFFHLRWAYGRICNGRGPTYSWPNVRRRLRKWNDFRLIFFMVLSDYTFIATYLEQFKLPTFSNEILLFKCVLSLVYNNGSPFLNNSTVEFTLSLVQETWSLGFRKNYYF